MTVAELIEALRSMPQDAEVYCQSSGFDTISVALIDEDGDVVLR